MKDIEIKFNNARKFLEDAGFIIGASYKDHILMRSPNGKAQINLVKGSGDTTERNSLIRFGKISFENYERFSRHSHLLNCLPWNLVIPDNKAQWGYIFELIKDAEDGVYLKRLERNLSYSKYLLIANKSKVG